jgi:hypothetical protein
VFETMARTAFSPRQGLGGEITRDRPDAGREEEFDPAPFPPGQLLADAGEKFLQHGRGHHRKGVRGDRLDRLDEFQNGIVRRRHRAVARLAAGGHLKPRHALLRRLDGKEMEPHLLHAHRAFVQQVFRVQLVPMIVHEEFGALPAAGLLVGDQY